MCLGGIKDEEHISPCEVSQSRRQAREETGVDCRWSQDFGYGLSHYKKRVPYKELGKDYLLQRRKDKIVKNHIKRLRDLGYEVELKKAA